MNTVKVCFTQALIVKGKENIIGFEKAEETELEIDRAKLKLWASWNLFEWYQMQVLQGKSTFNLKKSIKIEIYWNTKLELTLMQKRVTKDTIIRQNEDEPIKLKNCLYILISYRDNNLRSVKLLKQRDEPVIDPINPEMVFNTIEYFNNDRYKYGSPIIYTGMTN